jgi:hypothetical protein
MGTSIIMAIGVTMATDTATVDTVTVDTAITMGLAIFTASHITVIGNTTITDIGHTTVIATPTPISIANPG